MLHKAKENLIGRLLRDDGSWVEGEEEKKMFISNYFVQLFRSSEAVSGGQLRHLLDAVQPSVTAAMNEHLLKEFTCEEITYGGCFGLCTVFLVFHIELGSVSVRCYETTKLLYLKYMDRTIR